MSSSDLPFRVEYAKSGRASCKGCRQKIDKDSLRLARMVQSPMFDGKIPNWYHEDCFFPKAKVENFTDIAHLDSLRWEDQQRIKDKIGSSSGSKDTTDENLEEFQIEYAKSGKSKCLCCDEAIPKGEIRIGKTTHEGEKAMRFGPYKQWYHKNCFIKVREELEFRSGGDKLPGFKSLKDDDKKEVKNTLKPTKKRKTDSKKEAGGKKVKKEETEDDIQLKKQNKIMFKYRDQLKDLTKKELAELLEYNDQELAKGESALLDRLCDIMTFGAISPCKECDGQLVYSRGYYKCTGNMSEWTKCQLSTREISRTPFKVPDDLKEKYSFLNNYKYKNHVRIYPKDEDLPSTASTTTTTDSNGSQLSNKSTSVKKENTKPLDDMKLVIAGKLSRSKAVLTKLIKEHGGTVESKVDNTVLAVISNEGEVKKYSKQIENAYVNQVHVVSEDFLDAVCKGGAVLMVKQYSICDWGSDPGDRIGLLAAKEKEKEETMYTKSVPTTMKMKVKGDAVVEPDSGLESDAHVLSEKNIVYNAVLGMVDVQRGTNSYYKLQALESDSKNRYWLFRAWGRLGTTIGGSKTENFSTKKEMLDSFYYYYRDKTGNSWKDRNNFEKIAGKFFPMEIEYGQDDDETLKLAKVKPESNSSLPKAVQDLVCLIFDVDNMRKTMVEYEIDLKKMPLGKISKRQIETAYKVLKEVINIIKEDSNPNKLLDASNRFYTLIPHDFGMKKPPLLDNEEIVKNKIEMLDNLLEIEIAYNLLKGSESVEDKCQIDVHYEKLKSDIDSIEKSSAEFKMIKKYVKNTHAVTHNNYDLEVLEAFRVRRNGEDKRYKPFKKLDNKMLLWHGSRTTNFGGILSQGLRIAPPEAPSTGYMFGKGIYFADMVSKSANYCRTSFSDPTGLMLLCEVACGNMLELLHSDYIEKLPPGKHSTKGCGSTVPDPKNVVITDDGVKVPLGKGVQSNVNSSLLYNEYIVYDTAQVSMKYMLKLNFKHKY